MRVVGLPRSFYHIARLRPSAEGLRVVELSSRAQERLRYLSCFQSLREQGLSSSRASETLSLPRSTLYRWQQRLKKEGPQGLALQPKGWRLEAVNLKGAASPPTVSYVVDEYTALTKEG